MYAHPSGNAMTEQQPEQDTGVMGNERLTTVVSLVLLVLIIVELVTSAFLRLWLTAHTVVGVLLAGPLLLKMGATGWRFLRYYTRAPAYVHRGPPPLMLRVLGPVLLVTTLVMIGSGIGLVVTGPLQPFLLTHVFSALLWLPLIAVHSLAHFQHVKRSIASDWSSRQGSRFPIGRVLRLGANLGALLLGVIGAWLLLPAATPLFVWGQTHVIGVGPFGVAPLLVGMGVALLAILFTRPWTWGRSAEGA
jgi:hypothetical protein